MSLRRLPALTLLLAVVACHDEARFKEPQLLGGVQISAEHLNRGYQLYTENCVSCHGSTGAGDGPRAKGMDPPPRDLQEARFEFTSGPAGTLPTDHDLIRVIQHGLTGTQMGPTRLSDVDAAALAQYLKTLSPRWLHEGQPAPLRPTMHFNAQDSAQLIEMGKHLYHVEAKCWACHPAYETKEYIYDQSYRRIREFRADLYDGRIIGTMYRRQVKATDFLTDQLKSGTSDAALYRTIAAGLGGVQMPGALDSLDELRVWAIVFYVRSLIDEKEHGKAAAIQDKLRAQASWQPGD